MQKNHTYWKLGVAMAALLYAKGVVEEAEKVSDAIYEHKDPMLVDAIWHVQLVHDGKFDAWIEDMERLGFPENSIEELSELRSEKPQDVLEGMASVIAYEIFELVGAETYHSYVDEWNGFVKACA
jgi:hypothetical protein